MSEALVQITDNAVGTLNDLAALTGMDNVEIRPSRLILVQQMTQDPGDAKVGQYLDSLTRAVYDKIDLVPLRVRTKRSYYAPGSAIGDAPPICASRDGVYPAEWVETPQSQTCASCPLSQWNKKQKPACALVKELYCVTRDTGLPKIINFKGTGIAVINALLERIKQDIIAEGRKGNRLQLYSYSCTLHGGISPGKVKYALPRFDNLAKLKDPNEFGALFAEYIMHEENRKKFDNAEESVDSAISDITDGPDGPAPF